MLDERIRIFQKKDFDQKMHFVDLFFAKRFKAFFEELEAQIDIPIHYFGQFFLRFQNFFLFIFMKHRDKLFKR